MTDSSFSEWGLMPLREVSEPFIDIVAVHGPLGAREKSWTYDGTVWLKDILPGDMPKANIYTYGYRSESPLDIIAQNFIKALDNVRGNRSLYDTPIAFVTHAKGGLIVKQALIMLNMAEERSKTRILSNTHSILFFGVYHRGLLPYNMSTYIGLKFYARLLGFERIPSDRELRTMLEAFARISGQFRIHTFINTITTPFPFEKLTYANFMTCYLGLPTEEIRHVNATYADMIRFTSASDPGYQEVLSILRHIPPGHHGMSRDGTRRNAQLFRVDGTESEPGKQWFSDLCSDVHRVIESRPVYRTSKIAILDSGVDRGHHCFREAVSEKRLITKSFVEGLPGDKDNNGHGTHTAHLALKVAPRAKLFVARVYEDGSENEFDANIPVIVEAIKWSVNQGVDIISMSFGYRRENESVKAAIRDAFHSGIIILAAASNSGVNPRFPISFPANMRQVICIHSSDGNGNPSSCNPPATPDCNLAILGEGVAAAWPSQLSTERQDNLRVASGTSVATPIAAGLAALIIHYAAQGGRESEVVANWSRLRHCDEMRKVFESMARERAGYQSIAPSSLFDYHGERMHQRVCGRIDEILDSP